MNVKIITTVGPSSFDKSIIQKMDNAGVDIFRINLSHTKIEDLKGIIYRLKEWTSKEICIDTEGAQLRTGSFVGGTITVKVHDLVEFISFGQVAEEGKITLSVENPCEVLQPGDVLKIDFHSAIVQIIKIENRKIFGRVLEGGIIGSNKGISIDRKVKLPGFTKKDIMAFEIAKGFRLKSVALSFTSSAKDVINLRDKFDYRIFIISKIESYQGLNNLEDICQESDAILIDRGDLSRDVPIEKIAFAQQYIQKKATELKTPVYVATNLLESMITNDKPTRAEISDITYTLFSGADGLVLAAETAIGRYPVESVRLVSRVINEVAKDGHKGDINYLCSIPADRIIGPHGGELIQNFLWSFDRELLKDLPHVEVDDEILSDIVHIAEGAYSPLKGFMTQEELGSVLCEYKLPNGITWPMPILLQIDEYEASTLPERGNIGINRKSDGKCYAILELLEKSKIVYKEKVAKKWFGTSDMKHPGVDQFMGKGEWMLSGKVFLIEKPIISKTHFELSPNQTRDIFNDLGWHKIVGFHTRDVIHRGHEHIQRDAVLKTNADALFISPVVGRKNAGDFSAEAILNSYQAMIRNGHYNPFRALIGTFNTYPRYNGPREDVFAAICRKNFGCSHFIVVKDIPVEGRYYANDSTEKLLDSLDIGVEILTFGTVYYCQKCNKTIAGCIHDQINGSEISGSRIREYLMAGKPIPEYLIREDIALVLSRLYTSNPDAVFEHAQEFCA